MFALTATEFQERLRKERETAKAELAEAHQTDKAQLRDRIGELERQIAEPEKALADAKARIADLEERLKQFGNEIGGDRLAEAQDALQRLDYSKADEIFAEVAAREALAVDRAARAAFGRGEIAEAQVRWNNAAEHYAEAARLKPNFDSLNNAQHFMWRAGRYPEAIGLAEDLVSLARQTYTQDDSGLGTALNNLAECYRVTGRFEEAEPLYREALKVTRAALGEAHPDYAGSLNNLALLLWATDRLEEAEPLYRDAVRICEAALGAEHPSTKLGQANLQRLLAKMGRD